MAGSFLVLFLTSPAAPVGTIGVTSANVPMPQSIADLFAHSNEETLDGTSKSLAGTLLSQQFSSWHPLTYS